MKEYREKINDICAGIHDGLVDFNLPRSKASRPTLASSEFITNKQQGDWAEDVLVRAINENSLTVVAVKYGKSDNLVAGDPGFEKFFQDYQLELDTIGKRPDILLFRKEDFNEVLGYDISRQDSNHIGAYVSKAIAGIEVRSSAFLIDKYMAEADRAVAEATRMALEIRTKILDQYLDLLKQKDEELIPLLQQLNEKSVRSLSFRVPSWRTSQRLQELSSLLSELKGYLKELQKRHTLSITPKVEDLKVVRTWIETYNVPHFYVQVFFDKIYGIPFRKVLELIANPDLEDKDYFIEQDAKNQNKITIKISARDCPCIAQRVTEPDHTSVRKELGKGRLLYYVTFSGGEAVLDKEKFDAMFGCEL